MACSKSFVMQIDMYPVLIEHIILILILEIY